MITYGTFCEACELSLSDDESESKKKVKVVVSTGGQTQERGVWGGGGREVVHLGQEG